MKSPPQEPVITSFHEAFTAIFGQPLDLWILFESEWHHAVEPAQQTVGLPASSGAIIAAEVLRLRSQSFVDPIVEELTPGLYLVGTPLVLTSGATVGAGCTAVAWGTVQTTYSELVAKLLRVSRMANALEHEVAEFRTGLAPHLEQITYDFEQLTWLRRLSEQIDLSDSMNPLRDLTATLLPDLCHLLQAEGMVFIESVRSGPTDEFPVQRAGRALLWSGMQLLDNEQSQNLVTELYGTTYPGEIVVRNHLDVAPDWNRDLAPNTRSCVQVPVVHRTTCYGWLVALNRIPWSLRAGNTMHAVPAGFCDDEFGTAEASLMNSAATTLAACARNAELLREKELLLIGVVRSLINAIDAKDPYTCGHSDRVALMARCIGEKLQLESRDCERLYMAGLLHDIGKIGVPDHVLLKPGKLTDEEFALIRQHPTIGHEILKHLTQIRYVLPGVLHHHEMINGQGYPDGLQGSEIPLFGRILAVADAYDAMTSARPYRTAMPTAKAESILSGGAGTQWDATVVQAFLQSMPSIRKICERSMNQLQSLLRPSQDDSATWHDLESDSIVQAVSALES